MPDRQPYSGSTRQLVIAIDVGTTYSGVSYSILDPGVIPVIRNVTRFPDQDGVGGDSRIPTVVVYDSAGRVRAVGATADSPGIQDQADDEGWFRSEWFKLHLRPKDMKTGCTDDDHELPPRKSVETVFADFLRYIVDCTKKFISDSHVNGAAIWNSQKEFILTHPNGWGGGQQAKMRQAAVMAGIVPDTPAGRESIHFVTEGEASLHYCISNDVLPDQSVLNAGVLILDIGGGTIDASQYRKDPQRKGVYEEMSVPECDLQGSVYVTRRARIYLRNYLMNSKYRDDWPAMGKSFDKVTKLRFKDSAEAAYIKFGLRETEKEYNIRNGSIKLDGTTVAQFFEPSLDSMQSIIQRAHTQHNTKVVLLVGGFAGNEWIFKSLKTKCESLGVSIYRPDSHTAKAVADGAISYRLDNFVQARISKHAFGYICRMLYDPKDPEHVKRQSRVVTSVDGSKRLPDYFDIILPKGKKVDQAQEFRESYIRKDESRQSLANEKADKIVYSYHGPLERPRWKVDENPNTDYKIACKIPFDTNPISHIIEQKTSPSGQQYYTLDFDVILLFGLTELKAQIAWKENGKEKRTNAVVVYED